jgi:hypothetical protein
MTNPNLWSGLPVTLRSRNLQRLLGIRQTTVSLWFRQGVIPGYLIHHSWFAFRPEVRAWVESTANWFVQARAPDPDPLDAYGDVLSVADAAELFRMSPQAAAGWLRDGVFRGRKDGRR